MNIDSIGRDYLKDMLEDEPDGTEEGSELVSGQKKEDGSQDNGMDEASRLRLMKIEYRTERRRLERMRAIEEKLEASRANQAPAPTPDNNTQTKKDNTSDSSMTDLK